MERVTVYIDGFNFYYGLKRAKASDSDWKQFYWIDFVKLFELFLAKHQVLQKVIYFTTPPINLHKRIRQELLLKANKMLNDNRFEVIEGKFYDKEILCPLCNKKFTRPEEKRTDVNICVQIMRDCALDLTDVLILISSDSDLVPSLEQSLTDYPNKRIKIYFPPKGFSNDMNHFMRTNKGKIILLEKNKPKFFKAIMPDTITKDGRTVTIPPKWKV